MANNQKRGYRIVSGSVCALLMLVIMLLQPFHTVFADTVPTIELNSTAAGPHVYLFPRDGAGLQEGRLWLYLEVMDKKGNPVPAETLQGSLTLHMEISGQEDAEQELEQDLEKLGSGLGAKRIDITPGEDKIYTIGIRLNQNGELIMDRVFTIDEIALDYPVLSSDRQEKQYAFNEKFDMDSQRLCIAANWDDNKLVRRIFTTTCKPEDKLKVETEEYEGRNYLYTYRLLDMGAGEITISFTDLLGYTYSLPYTVKIERAPLPLALKGLILAGIILLGVLIFFRTGSAKREKAAGEDFGSRQKGESVFPAAAGDKPAAGAERIDPETALRRDFERHQEEIHDKKMRFASARNKTRRLMAEMRIPETDRRYCDCFDSADLAKREKNYDRIAKEYAECQSSGVKYDIADGSRQLVKLIEVYRDGTTALEKLCEQLLREKETEAILNTPLALSVRIEASGSDRPLSRFIIRKDTQKGGSLAENTAHGSHKTLAELFPELAGLSVRNSPEGSRLVFQYSGSRLVDANTQKADEFVMKAHDMKEFTLLDENDNPCGSATIKVL